MEAYRRGQYVVALEHLLQSNRLAPNKNVAFNVARAYEQLGRYPEAYRWYSDYLEVETDADRRASAERALDALRARVALVRVTTDPPGAAIYVDRKDLGVRGRTPRTLALEPGEHRILLEREGHDAAWSPPTTLTVGREATVHLPLRPILGDVAVVGSPAGAEVRVDDEGGPAEATLPATLRLPPGPHVLIVTAPGHEPVRQLVQVEARGAIQASVALPLITGTLVVDAPERDALVEIDGEAAGFTPTVLNAVPAGKHTVRVTLPGYRPYEAEVEVEPRGSVTLAASLVALQEVTAASRATEEVEDAPASVSLVGGEELRAFGHQTLYDALRGVRGVYGHDDRTYKSLGIRGFSIPGDYGSHVLLTLDGHPLNDDLVGASYVGYDLMPDLLDVARVEVVRGPGSALYGSNAFFGVVNVVTRDGDAGRPAHVSVAGDTGAAGRLRAGAKGPLGDDGGWWLSAGGVAGQGDDLALPGLVEDGVVEDADALAAIGLRGRARKGDWSLQVYGNSRDKRIPTGAFETIPGDPRAHTEDSRAFGELRWDPAVSAVFRVYTRAFVDHYAYRGAYPYDDPEVGVVADAWDGTWTGAEARAVIEAAEWVRVTGGAQVDAHVAGALTGSDASGTYLDEDGRYSVLSAYAETDLSAGRAVDAVLGGRVDHYSTFGTAFSPRVALLVHPNERHTVKLLGGRAFRAPSVYQLFYNDDGASQIAAPRLGPETVLTGEAEWSARVSEVVTVAAGAFYSDIEGLVELVEVDEEGTLQYRNARDAVRAAGVEAEARREWRRGWMLAASATWQRVRVGDLGSGDPLANSPAWLAGVRAAAPLVPGQVTGASRLVLEAPRRTAAGDETGTAVIWDATLTGRVPALGLDWGLGARNLLDWDVEHPGGEDIPVDTVPQPGRSLYAEATVSF